MLSFILTIFIVFVFQIILKNSRSAFHHFVRNFGLVVLLGKLSPTGVCELVINQIKIVFGSSFQLRDHCYLYVLEIK